MVVVVVSEPSLNLDEKKSTVSHDNFGLLQNYHVTLLISFSSKFKFGSFTTSVCRSGPCNRNKDRNRTELDRLGPIFRLRLHPLRK